MNQRRKQLFAAIAAAGMLALPSLGLAQDGYELQFPAEGAPSPQRFKLAFVNQTTADEEETRWIGVQVSELPPILKKHLKLEHGVLAEGVLPDAPAAKAGIEQDDVLLTIEGKEIARPEDVREAVEAADEGDSLELTLLHEGKETTVKIVPERRPTERVLIDPITTSGAAASQQEFLQHQHQAMKALERALADHQAAGMMLVRPGIVTAKPVELPKDVSVNVTHHNGKKSITVIRGKEQWQVTEDSLDKLPEELRAPVATIVHGPGINITNLDFLNNTYRPQEGRANLSAVPPKVRVQQSPEKAGDKLDVVLKELKSLRTQVEELQRAVQHKE